MEPELKPDAEGPRESRHFRRWFGGLDERIRSQAQAAGLYDHPTLTGDAREFLVQNVLRTFLPPSVHVGRGRVISSSGAASGQVDIVLFDNSFPFIRENDVCLFPVEGVYATIEVKSVLTTDTVRQALDNCRSVVALNKGVIAQDLNRELSRLAVLQIPADIVQQSIGRAITPRTHIFAFRGLDSEDALHDAVSEWFFERSRPERGEYPRLPQVIATAKYAAVTLESFSITGFQAIDASGNSVSEQDVRKFIMGFWSCTNQFALLAISLLQCIEERRVLHSTGLIRLGCARYYTMQEYHAEYFEGKPFSSICAIDTSKQTKRDDVVPPANPAPSQGDGPRR